MAISVRISFIFILVFSVFISSCGDSADNNNPGMSGTLSATPDSIDSGQTATLSWAPDATSATATSASIDAGIGSVPVTGSVEVSPDTTTTYTITWTGENGSAAAQVTVTVAPVEPEWALVWSDEFNYTGVPDNSKWGYDIGGGGWGNNELQYYTDRSENARVENGSLIIEAKKETYSGKDYTSTRLISKNKGDWLYGKFEIRAKLPEGRGTWPAIWMLPTDWEYGDWPGSGEIDIMEHVGYDQGTIHGTVHTQSYNHSIGTQKSATVQSNDVSSAFHTYSLIWTPFKIDVFMDNVKYYTFINENNSFAEWPFDKRFHLIMNIAVGGDWGGVQGVDDSIFPQTLAVDYVRVYEKDSYEPEPPTFIDIPENGVTQIEAENYHAMSGIQTQTCSEGGLNIGWINTGDWLDYPVNIISPGTYTMRYRVASTDDTGSLMLMDQTTTVSQIDIPKTTDWQNWTTVSANVILSGGTQTLRIKADAEPFNINWFSLEKISTSIELIWNGNGSNQDIK